MAQVRLLPEAQTELLQMEVVIKRRVLKIVGRLEKWPHVSGAKSLHGDLSGQFRIRTGGYRVQFYYDIQTDTIFINQVGYRKGFYE